MIEISATSKESFGLTGSKPPDKFVTILWNRLELQSALKLLEGPYGKLDMAVELLPENHLYPPKINEIECAGVESARCGMKKIEKQ